MTNPMPLPPGAKLVSDPSSMPLPPGAKLVSNGSAPTTAMSEPAFTPQQTSYLQTAKQGAKDLLLGGARGVSNTASNIDQAVSRIPGVGKFLTTPIFGNKTSQQSILQEKQFAQPQNTMQSIGRGLEQAGEFLLPMGAEEKAGTWLASRAPSMAKFVAPAGRVAAQTATSGLLNKAQGGSFLGGAAAGAGGSLLGEAGHAIAPSIAESALGIRKADRGFGKTPGQSILSETRGIRPQTVASSAQERIDQLTPELEEAVNRVSARPAPAVRGLLQPPQESILLSRERVPRGTRGGLFPAQANQEWHLGQTGETVPGEYGYGNPLPKPQFLSGSEHPELSGSYAPPKGILNSRDLRGGKPPVDEFGRIAYPPPVAPMEAPRTLPNATASLAPARSILSRAINTATERNAAKEVGQLTPLDQFLNTRFNTGEKIPEMVTPRELLNLKRGFGGEFTSWNPETLPGVSGTARNAYHALDQELDRTVPEAAGLNQRISSLIPVAKRAESTSREAGAAQRIAHRVAAHTGAATLGGVGAAEGYRHNGILGAVSGGLLGIAAPELLISPPAQMATARVLASPVTARAARGALAQAARNGGSQ